MLLFDRQVLVQKVVAEHTFCGGVVLRSIHDYQLRKKHDTMPHQEDKCGAFDSALSQFNQLISW